LFKVQYLEIVSMLANRLTKYLLAQKFKYFKKLLNLKELSYKDLTEVELQEYKQEI
jgi:hypothetical protein